MKIVDIEVAVVHAPIWRSIYTDEAAIVLVHTDEGLTGIGEAGAHPFAVKALLEIGRPHPWERAIKDVLRGEDPSDPRPLWEKMRAATRRSGRVGLGHVAIGAVDTALWDLAGKIHQVPVWQLLGGQQNPTLTPYVSLYHPGPDFEQVVARTLDDVDRLRDAGYRAVKIEALERNTATNREVIEYTRRVREHVGPDFGLMLDVGYRWRDFTDGYDTARAVEQYDLLFLESPFADGNWSAWRQLGEALEIPTAGPGGLTGYEEWVPWLELNLVDIVQPGVHRAGLSDCDRICKTAHQHGRQAVPFALSATTFTVAATIHVAATNPNVSFIEYEPPYEAFKTVVREELGLPEPIVRDGLFELPTAPGLGVELDPAAFARFRVA